MPYVVIADPAHTKIVATFTEAQDIARGTSGSLIKRVESEKEGVEYILLHGTKPFRFSQSTKAEIDGAITELIRSLSSEKKEGVIIANGAANTNKAGYGYWIFKKDEEGFIHHTEVQQTISIGQIASVDYSAGSQYYQMIALIEALNNAIQMRIKKATIISNAELFIKVAEKTFSPGATNTRYWSAQLANIQENLKLDWISVSNSKHSSYMQECQALAQEAAKGSRDSKSEDFLFTVSGRHLDSVKDLLTNHHFLAKPIDGSDGSYPLSDPYTGVTLKLVSNSSGFGESFAVVKGSDYTKIKEVTQYLTHGVSSVLPLAYDIVFNRPLSISSASSEWAYSSFPLGFNTEVDDVIRNLMLNVASSYIELSETNITPKWDFTHFAQSTYWLIEAILGRALNKIGITYPRMHKASKDPKKRQRIPVYSFDMFSRIQDGEIVHYQLQTTAKASIGNDAEEAKVKFVEDLYTYYNLVRNKYSHAPREEHFKQNTKQEVLKQITEGAALCDQYYNLFLSSNK
ncbi:hypothetical protein [Schleiferilactobacillus perolens]|uniref:Uncharacterized protein n=1 Tax=Schleiferilactobacillus perolens DSM 12744 TaxID=1423792 RepID=A0A0R1MWE7_9LACO|nr:hypothetical protein [Schleiferilactobacillus perolens]KRL12573.1 hypothetical protein FD09_GL002892 [Schleiferilactobacillus perolens DSM 12744]